MCSEGKRKWFFYQREGIGYSGRDESIKEPHGQQNSNGRNDSSNGSISEEYGRSRENDLIEFKQAYLDIVKVCKKLGVSYGDMLKLTLVEIEALGSADMEQTVDNVNTSLYVAYQNAVLTAVATNNPKRFPSKAPKVVNKTAPKSGVADPKDIYDKIWQIAAMCGKTLDEPT